MVVNDSMDYQKVWQDRNGKKNYFTIGFNGIFPGFYIRLDRLEDFFDKDADAFLGRVWCLHIDGNGFHFRWNAKEGT